MTSPLPTDDDREALARELRGPSGAGAMPWAMVADVYLGGADRALAWMEREGFRRSVVSTPSEDARVWVCARCGHAPAAHAMAGHPAFQCIYEPYLADPAVSAPPTTGTDANPAPAIHEPGCEEWCNHCALCGAAILYGARCQEHLGVYPARPTITDEALLEAYRAANERAMREANLRDGFGSNMSRESILAGLRAVAVLGGEEKR